ncbi:AlbA family DNA-binding domain-containing protein [Rhodococcus sp. LB1]|uniref:AlbA family DNA-binding domain-containing protein n=1 Tax=Rhodococcus sp. LB1 TaxID=1807499 RepID=UPI00077AAB6A|nr:ATP-binding protein [Rhodococcus sp. LB1]KXX54545.1 hypothetical protein AZG88_02955 [Rhodococcus sp. LB1]
MLTAAEIEQHIANVGHETRSIEFKGAGNATDKYYFAKIVRAALSMANLRDGGYVVLGVDDTNGALTVTGLDADQISEWTNFDDLSSALAVYADPPLNFDVNSAELTSGAQVVVIQLHNFTDLPHLCAKGHNEGKDVTLRKGALYVRNRSKPETSEVASHVEMREVLSIATQNALREFVATAHHAGLQLQAPDASAHSTAAYDRESAEWETANDYARRQLGYWDIVIRPQPYDADRLDRDKLEYVLAQSTVRMRGWPVPYIDHAKILNGQTYIGCDIPVRNTPHEEQWRLFTSGQFLHRRVLMADLTDKPDQVRVWEVLFYLTEVVELAVRLSQSMTPPTGVSVQASLHGVAGRLLVSGEPGWHLHDDCRTSDSFLTGSIDVPVSELLTDTRALAVRMAKTILQGFGYRTTNEALSDYQQELDS